MKKDKNSLKGLDFQEKANLKKMNSIERSIQRIMKKAKTLKDQNYRQKDLFEWIRTECSYRGYDIDTVNMILEMDYEQAGD